MGGTILTAIINGVLQMAYKALSDFMEKRGLIQQGQAQQPAKETAASEASEARMNDALVNAPRTPEQALSRLRDGTA